MRISYLKTFYFYRIILLIILTIVILIGTLGVYHYTPNLKSDLLPVNVSLTEEDRVKLVISDIDQGLKTGNIERVLRRILFDPDPYLRSQKRRQFTDEWKAFHSERTVIPFNTDFKLSQLSVSQKHASAAVNVSSDIKLHTDELQIEFIHHSDMWYIIPNDQLLDKLKNYVQYQDGTATLQQSNEQPSGDMKTFDFQSMGIMSGSGGSDFPGINLANSMLYRKNFKYGSHVVSEINASLTLQSLNKWLYGSPMSMIIKWDGNEDINFTIDGSWNRVVSGAVSGDFIKSYGDWDGDELFSGPTGIAYGGDYIFIADMQKRRVVRLTYNKNNRELHSPVEILTHPFQVTSPYDVFSRFGELYVVDRGKNRIILANFNGNIQKLINGYYTPEGVEKSLILPGRIAANNDYVGFIDDLENAVVFIERGVYGKPTATRFHKIPNANLSAIRPDLAYNEGFWVTDTENKMVHKFSYDGTYLASYSDEFNLPISIVPVDNSTDLYIVNGWDYDNGLRKYSIEPDILQFEAYYNEDNKLFSLHSLLANTCRYTIKLTYNHWEYGYTTELENGIANSGDFIWTASLDTLSRVGSYVVEFIVKTLDGEYRSSRSYYLNITEGGLQLLYPRGGEAIVNNSTIDLKFKVKYNFTANLKIEYSPNNGNNWHTINDYYLYEYPLDYDIKLTQQWTVPSLSTSEALIRVSCINNCQAGNDQMYVQSNTFRIGTCEELVPLPPQWITATTHLPNSIELFWGDADFGCNTHPDIHGYFNIYRREMNSDQEILLETVTAWFYTENNYVDYQVSSNKLYEYKITTVDLSQRESDPTGYVTGAVTHISLDGNVPLPPEWVVASTNLPNSIHIQWGDAFGGDWGIRSYNVYKRPSSSQNFVLTANVTSTSTGSEYIDYNVSNGVPYYYKISTVDGMGRESSFSEYTIGVSSHGFP